MINEICLVEVWVNLFQVMKRWRLRHPRILRLLQRIQAILFSCFVIISLCLSVSWSQDGCCASLSLLILPFFLSTKYLQPLHDLVNTSWETLNKSLSVLQVWISSGIKLKVLDQSWSLHMCNNQCIFISKNLAILRLGSRNRGLSKWHEVCGRAEIRLQVSIRGVGLFDFATIMSELDSLRNTHLNFNKNDKVKVAFQFLSLSCGHYSNKEKNDPSYPLSKSRRGRSERYPHSKVGCGCTLLEQPWRDHVQE